MNRFAVVTLLGLIGSFAGTGAIIADLQNDFTPVNPSGGWRYLRSTGTLGDDSSYAPLVWNPTDYRYETSGDVFPAPDLDFSLFAAGGIIHPGRGLVQGNGLGGYLIFAYILQPGQSGDLVVNGSIAGIDPDSQGNSNGWDILFFAGNNQSGDSVNVPWGDSAQSFAQWLGRMDEGSTVYVAIGPNGADMFDIAQLSLTLEIDDEASVPEPGSAALLAIGVGIIGLRLLSRR